MGKISELTQLHDRTGVFADRVEAGRVLAELLVQQSLPRPLVLAVPAGGVPVAVPLAIALKTELKVAVVSKITFPWNSEAGYGAVAFDGSCLLNRELIHRSGLSEAEVVAGTAATRSRVERRVKLLERWQPPATLAGRAVILVDDGIASGLTLQAAIAALREAGADNLQLAVPTGHSEAVKRLAALVDGLTCANLRGGLRFAVADAYLQWRDVAEEEALQLLQST